MTNEQIYCDIADDLEEKILSGEYEWDCICSVKQLKECNGDYGIVVWCDDTSGEGKCFDVSIRKDFSSDNWDGTEPIISESTDTDSFEELETVICRLLNKFRTLAV